MDQTDFGFSQSVAMSTGPLLPHLQRRLPFEFWNRHKRRTRHVFPSVDVPLSPDDPCESGALWTTNSFAELRGLTIPHGNWDGSTQLTYGGQLWELPAGGRCDRRANPGAGEHGSAIEQPVFAEERVDLPHFPADLARADWRLV